MAETLPENDPGRGQAARGDPSAIGDPAQAQLPAHQRPSALIIAWALALIGLSLFYSGLRIGWALLGDGVFNRHTADRPAAISETERRRWAASVVMDWHADSLLWNRSLTAPSDEGHWDLPRARQGGLDLQMLTIVSDVREPIGLLALAQGWPLRTVWDPAARINYQIDRFHRLVERAADEIVHVHDRASLERAMSGDAVGLLLGLEGIHGIEDRPEAIDEWFALGVRMASVVHRHDNHYGSSSGGSNRTGPDAMTEGGRSMLRRMRELGMILDLSHAAPGFIDEALGIYEGGPIVASHTGFQRHCDRPRNLSAEHSRAIGANGGLVAVMFAPLTLCGGRVDDLVESVRFAIAMAGEDHVALGSDWDGFVSAVGDVSEIPKLLAAMQSAGMSGALVRKVAGENSLGFLRRWLR